MSDPNYHIYIGSSGSGKTSLIKYIIERNYLNYQIIILKGTYISHEYDQILEKSTRQSKISGFKTQSIITKLNSDNLETILYLREKQFKNKTIGFDKKILLVLEDVYNIDISTIQPLLTRLFSGARHYNIELFMTAQSIQKVPRIALENATSIIFRMVNKDQCDKLYKYLDPVNISFTYPREFHAYCLGIFKKRFRFLCYQYITQELSLCEIPKIE